MIKNMLQNPGNQVWFKLSMAHAHRATTETKVLYTNEIGAINSVCPYYRQISLLDEPNQDGNCCLFVCARPVTSGSYARPRSALLMSTNQASDLSFQYPLFMLNSTAGWLG